MTERGRQLLVIDDDSLVRQSIVAYLEDSGFRVHEESDGHSGIAWFRKNKPDLVLTDLRMPDLDGLSLMRAVKQIDPDTPVIVISGLGMVSDVVEALRLGAADYLIKPLVDMEVLTHSINKALSVLDLQRENQRYRRDLEKANREMREYVRVLERDQQAGRQVQINLLPPTPVQYGNITVAHKIVPSLYLSGDFIDYGLINNRYLSFYLTDISGHGASSAFVTVWLKQLVRRIIRERRVFQPQDDFQIDAAEWLSMINQELMRSKFGCHLTCFVGILDTETREMRYVLGGHLPLPVLVVDGEATFLPGKGKPVGIFKDATWEVFHATLPEKFSLTVFSDGILEVLPPLDLIGKEQCLLDLMKNSPGDLEGIWSGLGLDKIRDMPDDIAVLTLKAGDVT
ncbi:response regulator [Saccharophagus sp. K07]|jgi:sigma-B regulation protein RsbU (phosphoserine phosphatase)|uniref:response regulator n=1 Tax=Saccharophagus sp. K07 TaxID=2283636 RepID=UPI001651D41C|nr:response regulator [Saccharophagus sp. K07]MBC6904393.1 response regulator [Saccharophagus sp. K07]